MTLRARISDLIRSLARHFGTRIVDQQTGGVVGRAFLIPFRGKIFLIGYSGPSLRVGFRPQERLTYWRQEIVFSTLPPVDFPRETAGEGKP